MAADRSKQQSPFALQDVASWGCLVAMAIGVVLFGFGMWMIVTGKGPTPLRVAVLMLGVSNSLLAYRALTGSRVAWAFVTATCGTLAIICLFGAPKFRDTTGFSLLVSAVPFAVFTATTVLLSFRHAQLDR